MELCGIEGKKDDPKLDGHSLVPLLRSAKAESGYGEVLHFQWHTQWAVRKGEWKLIGRGTKASFLGNLSDEQPELKNHARKNRNWSPVCSRCMRNGSRRCFPSEVFLWMVEVKRFHLLFKHGQ